MKNHYIQQSSQLNYLAIEAIALVQINLDKLGYKPQIHFELEGCYRFENDQDKILDFNLVNR